ncbi:four-carbon acid sugar kinase family protein [Streptomyces sp. NPDC002133]|uniref:four-carbon acid sugar kinase family protein n=1 Tax=Streptomyces sp. NPDC002133 TaxID=3154409 RepID=UPI0033173DF2
MRSPAPTADRPPRRIAILADDLTSAGDGAAPFRAAGFPARIRLSDEAGKPAEEPAEATSDATAAATGPGVTAVDLDSRVRPAAHAAERTAAAAAALAGADVLLKTVDSTLRGHLAAETAAALSASGRRTAVIAPAFPAEERTTVGGVQLLAGRPVHDTAFARDPLHPVRCADLTKLFPGAVRAGLASLPAAERLVLADAASDGDLDALVAAVPDPGQVLWVGSPGLAAALARRLGPGPGGLLPAGDAPSPAPRVLVVVGSLHPAGREQAARFAAVGGTAALVPVTDPAAVVRAEQALAGRGRALLQGPEVRTADSVPEALARVVGRLAARQAFDALVLTGGETARTVLLALGARTVDLSGEPEPGIALGLLDRPRRIPVALKAGGFGDRDTLCRLTDLLRSTPCAAP